MKSTFLLLLFLVPTLLIAQVGINTTNPQAKLDIRPSNQGTPANNDGILIPKIDEFPAINPTVNQDGMMFYASGLGSVARGFHFWDNVNSTWSPMLSILKGRGYAETTANISTTATIPFDNTKPQSSEGAEILTVSITPKSSTNKLHIRVLVPLGSNQKDEWTSVAVFRDSGVNAIAATAELLQDKPDFIFNIMLDFEVSAGSTSTTTFKVRVGPTAGTLYVNGTSTGQKFGGVSRASITVEELSQ